MYKKLVVILCFVFSFEVKSQEYPDPKRFYNEIKSELEESPFKKSDKPLIVFSGSSSIRFWIDLDKDFIEYDILNRGFGGSIFSDLNYFINELIIKHNPDLIVLYEGDNDIAFIIPTKYIYEDFKKSDIFLQTFNSTNFALLVKVTLDRSWFNEKPFQGIIIDQPSTHLNFKILSSDEIKDKISSTEISKGLSTSPSILILQGFVLKFCDFI